MSKQREKLIAYLDSIGTGFDERSDTVTAPTFASITTSARIGKAEYKALRKGLRSYLKDTVKYRDLRGMGAGLTVQMSINPNGGVDTVIADDAGVRFGLRTRTYSMASHIAAELIKEVTK